MSKDVAKMKENAEAIQKGLFLMGRNRVAALPVHKTWKLIDDLEVRAAELLKAIEEMEK